MNSKEEIYMNYHMVRKKADSLEELADELRKITQSNIACYSSNKTIWKGDSGDVCRQDLTKLEKRLDKRAKELKNAARGLRAAAERQYKLEMTLVSLISG